MILLPKNNSRIYYNYQGPFQIINKKGDNHFFRINKSIRCYHADLLKTWFYRKPSEDITLATLAFIPMSEEEELEKESEIAYLTNKSTQKFKNVELNENLTPIQRAEVKDVLSKLKKKHLQMYQVEQMFCNMISDSLIRNLSKYTSTLHLLELRRQLRKKSKLCWNRKLSDPLVAHIVARLQLCQNQMETFVYVLTSEN